MTTTTNLETVLRIAERTRWRGIRTEQRCVAHARQLVEFMLDRGVTSIDDITSADMDAYADALEALGNGPVTVNMKCLIVSTLAKVALAQRPPLATQMPPLASRPVPRQLKWWLHPLDCDTLLEHLRTGDLRDMQDAEIIADYVEFVTHTGFRVEEALALRWLHVHVGEDGYEIEVPGRKTDRSQDTLPLSDAASAVVARRLEIVGRGYLFPVSYSRLRRAWMQCRKVLGCEDMPTATLKALRRTFARRATEKGMPTEILKNYLRHANLQTTLGYLQLTGGYSSQVYRKWL